METHMYTKLMKVVQGRPTNHLFLLLDHRGELSEDGAELDDRLVDVLHRVRS